MDKIFLTFLVVALTTISKAQSVSITNDGSQPDSKAMLDIKSSTKGLLIPRMSTAQRNAIGSPPTGLLVFDTDLTNYYFSAGGAWNQIGTGANTWSLNRNSGIYYNGVGSVGIGTDSPVAKLNINVANQFYGEALRLTGTNPFLSFNLGPNQKGYLWNKNTNDMELGTAGINPTGKLFFSIAGNPKLTISNDGRLFVNGNLNVNVGEQFYGEALRLTGTNPFLAFHDGITQTGYLRGNNQYDMELGTGGSNPTGNLYLDLMGNPKLSILSEGRLIANGRFDINAGNQFYGEALRLTGTNPFLAFHDGTNQKGYIWNKNTNDMEFGTAGVNPNGNLMLSIQGNPRLVIWHDLETNVNGPFMVMNGYMGLGDDLDNWKMEIGYDASLYWYLDGYPMARVSAATGSWLTYSDRKLKTNISKYKSVLAAVDSINIVTYEFLRKPNYKSFGLIAQNVREFFPEIVEEQTDKKGQKLLGIDYSKTGVIAIKAIQEQQIIIESLQKNIEELTKRLKALENK